MTPDSRIRKVHFVEQNLFDAFKQLESGKTEEKKLAVFLLRAVDDLKKDPECGIKVPRALWPKEYVQKYGITNLWKYNLPDAWRLVYTLVGNDVEVISVILEWFDHSDYEKRFGYKKK